jgi:RNA polymerase sigma-70 factor (sigma-E family)
VNDGGKQAFDALVALRSDALLRSAYLLTGDPHLAQDLVQSALVRTYLRWGTLRSPAAGEAYVRRTMFTQAASSWRRKWHGEVPSSPALPDGAAASEDLELREVLRRALLTLPPQQRAVLVLRFYEDMSEAETARVLGCSPGTVKSRTSRGLAALRDAGLESVLTGDPA